MKKMNITFLLVLILLGTIMVVQPLKKRKLIDAKFQNANVILILIDTLRGDHLGCYGYSRNTSPVIDKLAEEGILFRNMLAQTSWTRPGTASIMTGLYPKNHGANTRKDTLADEIELLPEILRKHGYDCYGFNPNGNAGSGVGFDQGYNSYSACREERQPGENHPVDSDEVNRILFKTINRLDRPTNNFIYIHYIDPHSSYLPREKHFSKNNPASLTQVQQYPGTIKKMIPEEREKALAAVVNAYDDEILFNDKMIGHLIGLLKKKKMYDNSIIIVTSDHGEEFFEHHGFSHGHTLYDEQLRVPLIIQLPDKVHMKLDKIANQVDILPTVLTLLDLPVPKNIDGTDLFKNVERHVSYAEVDLDKKRLNAAQTKKEKIIRGITTNFGWFRRSALIETDDHFLELKCKSSYVNRGLQVIEGGEIIHELEITPKKQTHHIPLRGPKKLRRIIIKSAKPPPVPGDIRYARHRKYHAFYLYNSVNIKDKNIKGEPYDGYFSLDTDPGEQINLFPDHYYQKTFVSLDNRLEKYLLKNRNFQLTKKPVNLDKEQIKHLEALGYI